MRTPGPWSTGGTANPGTEKATMNVWGPTPAGKQSGSIVAKDCKPEDASLISAAPELLNAIRWAVKHSDECLADYPEDLEAAKGLIAKAEGWK